MAIEQQHAANLAWARRPAVNHPSINQPRQNSNNNKGVASPTKEIAGAVAASVPVVGGFLPGAKSHRKKTMADRLTVYIWMVSLGFLGSFIPVVGNVAGAWAGRVVGNTKYGKPLLIVAVMALFLGIFILLALFTLLIVVATCQNRGILTRAGMWLASWTSDDVEAARKVCASFSF